VRLREQVDGGSARLRASHVDLVVAVDVADVPRARDGDSDEREVGVRADDAGNLNDPSDGGGARGRAGGAREVDAEVGESRSAGEAEGNVDGTAVAHVADGGGGVGDGVGGEVGSVVEEDRAWAQATILAWEQRRDQAGGLLSHRDGGSDPI
jgi:hypothetical protein